MTHRIAFIDHVAVTVSDIDRACAFYIDLLDGEQVFEYAPEGKPLARQVQCGGVMLSIHQVNNGIDLVAAKPTVGAVDIAFRWNGPIEEAQAHLAERGIEIIDGPRDNRANGGHRAKSVYFNDPDRNLLEFITVD
jgi:catechol 2,3-dioxygenase-like lactoylglutathione lyase family enzyme